MIAIDFVAKVLPGPLRRITAALLDRESPRARSQLGALTAFAIRVVSAALAFLSQVLLARWIGAHDFGVFTYVWVWINIVGTLSALGFATSVVRFVPGYQTQRRLDEARGFLRTGRSVAVGAGAMGALAGLAFIGCCDHLFADHYRVPFAIALLSLPAFALTDFQDGVGRSQGWIDLALGPPYVCRPLVILLLVGLGVASGWAKNAETAIYAALAATWFTAVLQYALQKRRMRRRLPRGPRRYHLGLWFKVSLPLLTLEGFSLLMTNLDILLLNLYVEPDQIAVYFAAARTIALISFVHFAVAAVAMPEFARLHALGDGAGIRRVLGETRQWTLWPSLAGAATLLALGKPLLWLFGPEFTAGYPLMFVLVAGLLALAAAGPVQGLLVVTGHHNLTALVLTATVLVNGTLNLALIPFLGLMGAALATSTALAFQALTFHLVARRVSGATGTALAAARAHGTPAE